MKTLELISFDLCPFVQRSVIILLKKEVDFKITYIDLTNKPDWFLAISPLSKVPLLRVTDEATGNEDVLFESAVINEYIDEVTPGSLLPQDSLLKAGSRAWIEYSSQLLVDAFGAMVAKTKTEFDEKQQVFEKVLNNLEQKLSEQGYFNGENFSLVDAAIAPIFTRTDFFDRHHGVDLLSSAPKSQKLAQLLLTQPYIKQSVIDGFDEKMTHDLSQRESYLARKKSAL